MTDDDAPPPLDEPPALAQAVPPREAQIWKFVADGMNTFEMAKLLNIQERTVSNLRASLYARMGFRNVADLTRAAVAHGIITVPPANPLVRLK